MSTSMTYEQFLQEAQQLTKPCMWLLTDDTQGPFAAVFAGTEAVVAPPEGTFVHWISVDCRYLPEGSARPGCLSVYITVDQVGDDPEDLEMGKPLVLYDPEADLSAYQGDGERLYARPEVSLPPVDGVFRLGSAAVKAWLEQHGWQPDWSYNSNFKAKEVPEAYNRTWQQQFPLYLKNVHAVLGGWHMMWPDADWDAFLEKTMVLCTFAEAEPWIEVWQDKEQLVVLEHYT